MNIRDQKDFKRHTKQEASPPTTRNWNDDDSNLSVGVVDVQRNCSSGERERLDPFVLGPAPDDY